MTDALILAPEAIHPHLTVIDGEATTTSLDVARFFGKRHDNVLREIGKLVDQLPAERALTFEATFRDVPGPNGAYRREHYYRLTFDAFVLLTMGFTGPKALAIKLAYMDEFNRLRREREGRAGGVAALLERDLAARRSEVQALQGRLLRAQAEQIRQMKRSASLRNRVDTLTRQKAVIDMARRGERGVHIAAATGYHKRTVRAMIAAARMAGELPPVDSAGGQQALWELDAELARRGHGHV